MKRAATLLAALALAAVPAARAQDSPQDSGREAPPDSAHDSAYDAALGGFDTIFGGKVVVKNNSATALTCQVSEDSAHWGESFAFNPGAEYSEWIIVDDGKLRFHCQAPMKNVAYSLHPGRRYSVLNSGDGVLELHEIVTG